MREFQEKRRIKRYLFSPPVILVLAIAVALMVKATWNVYSKQQVSREKLELAHEELRKLKEREAMLASSIGKLGTEEGVEEEIREKFRMAKEGEHLIVVLDSEDKVGDNTEELGWWATVKDFFSR